MDIDKVIKERYSCRKFSSKKPNWRDIIECVDAVRYAPMAGGICSVRVIIVDDKEKIQKLAEASQQDFVGSVDYVVVFCSNSAKTKCFEERCDRYCRQQAGAAIQNFLLKIQEKGMSTCWVGHFVDEQIKAALKIPDNIEVEAICPVGYELKKQKRKSKMEIDAMLYFNKYKNKKMDKPKQVKA